jgi:hypothetical protein
MQKLILAAVSSLIMISSFSVTAYGRTMANNEVKANMVMADLVDYELDNGFMTIKVLTAGCTGVNSFKVIADTSEENALRVMRVKRDQCGMKLRPIELQYSIRHLGLDSNQSINILNN